MKSSLIVTNKGSALISSSFGADISVTTKWWASAMSVQYELEKTKSKMLNMYQYYYCFCIERTSIEWRKTKTKVITLANHKARTQSSEPVKARSNNMQLTQSAVKRVRVSRLFFLFYRWLDEEWREFLSQSCSIVDAKLFDPQFM